MNRLEGRVSILTGALLVMLMMAHGVPLYCSPLIIHLAGLEYGWSSLESSMGFSMIWVVAALGMPVVGASISSLGPRFFAVLGGLALALGLSALGFVSELWHLLAGMALVGAGCACAGNVTTTAVLMANIRKEDRGKLTGILTLGISLAGVTVLPVVEALCTSFGWRPAAAMVGIIGGGSVMVATFFLPPRLNPVDDPGTTTAGTDTASYEMLDGRLFRCAAWPAGVVLRIILTTAFFAVIAGNCAVYAHLIPSISEAGLPLGQAAASVSMFAAFCIAGRFVGGWAADRWPIIPVLEASYLFQIAGIAILAYTRDFITLIGFVAVYGIGTGAMMPLHALAVMDTFGPARFAREYGFITMGPTLGNAIGPMISGFLRDVSGSYLLANNANAALAAAAIGLVWLTTAIRRSMSRRP